MKTKLSKTIEDIVSPFSYLIPANGQLAFWELADLIEAACPNTLHAHIVEMLRKHTGTVTRTNGEISVSVEKKAVKAKAKPIPVDEISEDEEARRGKLMATALNLRKSRDYPQMWTTVWGTKSDIGLFRMVKRIVLVGE